MPQTSKPTLMRRHRKQGVNSVCTRRSLAAILTLPVALLVLASSTGCTTSNVESRQPAPSRPSQSVVLSRACEDLARNVDDPVVTEQSDPWQKIGEYAVALGEANANTDATRECQKRQRERLAKGK